MPPPGATQRAAQKFIVFENFEKMNTQSVRQALSEKELAWLENLQPIAGNNLTTVPAPLASPTGSISGTAQSQFYASINGVDYIITFSTAGGGFATNIASGSTAQFAANATFSSAPDVTTWQASRILINDIVAGYCTWDGTFFVRQGSVSPVYTITAGGFGYTSPPSVGIGGGTGTGAAATAVISGGQVIGLTFTNPGTGYAAGDVLTVTFGTGAGTGATASITMSGSGVASVTITNGGSGYGSGTPPVVTFSAGGTTATGVAVLSGDQVVAITITNPGSGYTAQPTVTIAAPVSGTTATGTAILLGMSVASITLTAGGGGYPSPPSVVFIGGGGSGAAAHTTIAVGVVNTVTLDAGGGGYQAAPTVVITSGQGAAATVHVWPFIGIGGGTTLAVFQGRVWLNNNRILQYTGTGGFDDFDPAHASGFLTISDADLVHTITALRNFNNYLWIMGDQSVKQIGNISLNAAATVTLFTILTLSSDQGTIYPRSCGSFNRVFMFANSNGIYAVFGSSVQKISDDMDGIFKLIDFSQSPQAALVDINNIHNIAYLVRYVDPLASTRSILLTFNGKKWFVISQGNSLKTIATASKLSTGKTLTFGSSTSDITNILADPTIAVAFKAQSSLTHHGNAVQRKKTIRAGFSLTAGGSANVTMTVDTDEATNSYTRAVVSGFQTKLNDADGSGLYLGATITGTLAGFTLSLMKLEYQETNIGNKS